MHYLIASHLKHSKKIPDCFIDSVVLIRSFCCRMKIHHLNCGSMCPACKKLIQGSGSWLQSANLCCHCLAIETQDGLVLVDTGFGVQDIIKPQQLGLSFRAIAQPQLKLEETAIYQLDKLGFKRHDVKHIALTHLDLDHAGGLSDFPGANVHVHYREIDAALAPQDWRAKHRYRSHQFNHQPRWQNVEDSEETWFGFDNVKRLKGVVEDILLIPLAGHTEGHCGVAIKQKNNKWLFHVGDLYMDQRSLLNRQPKAIRNIENMLAKDNRQRLRNVLKVRQMLEQHSDKVEVFCAHDMNELERYTL